MPPYPRGFVGPLHYHQSNFGVETDTDTIVTYTSTELGGPGGAIIPTSVHQHYTVSRGTAYVSDLTIHGESISFHVFTQAAGAEDSGRRSGEIDVYTSFAWEDR